MKIIEVQEGLKDDINALVELKKEIMATIHAVEDVELQTLLEKRYLCFLSWEKIAVEMGYSYRNIHYLHGRALQAFEKVLEAQKHQEITVKMDDGEMIKAIHQIIETEKRMHGAARRGV